jgi:hypothetical protein
MAAAAVVMALFSVPERPAHAALWFLGAASLGLGYFRHGTVWLAFRAQRRGNTERAKRLLQEIVYFNWLSSQSQVYYQFLVGIHALDDGVHDVLYAAFTKLDAQGCVPLTIEASGRRCSPPRRSGLASASAP